MTKSNSGGQDNVSTLKVASYSEDPSNFVVGSFFNGLNIPENTNFKVYRNKKHSQNNNNEFILHGENDHLEYNGNSLASDDMNQYCVALYDPTRKTLELFDKSPLLLSTVTSKRKRKLIGPKIKHQNVKNNIKRNLLGEEFGTKRAKKAINDLEKNKIDSEKLEENELDIIDSIKSTTEKLPAKEDLNKEVEKERPIPIYNADAKNVEDIYPIHNIIPKKEFSIIRIDSILKESDLKKILEILPYGKSQYLNKRLGQIINDSSSNKKLKLTLIFYLSLLLGVYANKRDNNKSKLSTNLNEPSEILIDGILERFTIPRPGQFGRSKDRSFIIDPHHEDKLLCYILSLILHIDNFIVEVSPLAQELSLKHSKLVSLFRALGCTVKNCSVSQAEAFGISKSIASTYKIATLKVPFKVPETARKGRRGGR